MPHCHRTIPALFLTDTYLCPRHGDFEVSATGELSHVPSGRCWHQWDAIWYRQHIHVDGLRFETGEALDQLSRQGRRATQITIAMTLSLHAQHALSDYVTALAWSPVGNTLAIASGSGEVLLLHNVLAMPLQPANGRSIDAIGFSSDGQWLAAAGQAGDVSLWQMGHESPQPVDSLECGSTWIDRLQWHPQKNWLAFNRGKTVQIWDADRAEIVACLELPAHVQDLGWSPDGNHFAVSAQQQVHIWVVSQWQKPRYQWELLSASRRLSWSPEGAYLASANQDNSVGVLTWAQVHRLRQTPVDPTDLPTLLQGFPGKVRQLAWADIPDADKSPILAAATRDLVVMGVLVPGEDWESWLLDLHNGTVLDVAFQPKTGLLASLSEDGWIILWQAAVNAAQILEGADGGFSTLAWHPGGQHLAAGGQRGNVLVWSAVGEG